MFKVIFWALYVNRNICWTWALCKVSMQLKWLKEHIECCINGALLWKCAHRSMMLMHTPPKSYEMLKSERLKWFWSLCLFLDEMCKFTQEKIMNVSRGVIAHFRLLTNFSEFIEVYWNALVNRPASITGKASISPTSLILINQNLLKSLTSLVHKCVSFLMLWAAHKNFEAVLDAVIILKWSIQCTPKMPF